MNTSSVMRPWRPWPVIVLLSGYMLLFGITVSTYGVLWAEIMRALRLNEADIGNAQLASPLIATVILLAGGALVAITGKKRLALAGLALLGVAMIATARADGFWALIGAVLLQGVAFGALEMVINSATLDWEHATGRSVMNAMHAGFSGGAVIGALLAGALLEAGWTYQELLYAIAGLTAIALLATLPITYAPETGGDSSSPLAALRILTVPAIAWLALIGLLGVVGESVAIGWSVIYLQQLGADVLASGAAFALFNATMFAGRLLNAPLVARWGPRVSLVVSGVLLVIAGVLLMLPQPLLWVAIVAFALCGIGVAGVIPTVLSAAARVAPGQSGAITGAIMATAYLCFIVVPPVIGAVAVRYGLQMALVSVGASGVALLLLIRRVAQR
ncbi:MAG: MFS transporter [Chloroflexi bacterium]|nr:MFS transporter [Chloroflexota bacterium]